MKLLLKILAVLALLMAVLIVVIVSRPDEFTVARSAVLAAPADRVFAQVNDLRKWQEFSPWAKLDPEAKIAFSGPAAGEGAAFSWDGNREIGAGAMTIIESLPDRLVRYRLDFTRPFEDSNTVEFRIEPAGDQTAVIWTMSGRSNFVFKAMSLFMDCDAMIGGQFEQGLENLRRVVESPAGS